MAGIRVDTGDRRIEVNDQGEVITLCFSDQGFPGRVFSMIERIQDMAREAEAQEAEIRARHSGDGDSFAYLKEAAQKNEEIHRAIMAQVDGVFGQGTCRKVFGEIVPDAALFQDFFDQLTPYFEKYGRERAEKLKKYSAARTGNV